VRRETNPKRARGDLGTVGREINPKTQVQKTNLGQPPEKDKVKNLSMVKGGSTRH
jgi:hypothetical protein